MNFTTPVFLFYFLPFVLLIYFIFPKFRNTTLILASGLFYFWGEGRYLFSLYLWIIANFISAQVLYHYSKVYGFKRNLPKFCLILIITFNLGFLVYLKYSSFLFSSLNLFGISMKDLDIYLPLGISFFTFHAISYNVDIFRGVNKPEYNLFKLILYFSFFPHLIAGPIIRYHEVYRYLYKRVIKSDLIAKGINRFVIGLIKKIVIANTLAAAADEIFAVGPQYISIEQAWLGAICFALQIYYDFSGYTDMAIGLGLIFGFKFPENFNYPYTATSITEFWHRWHMTLSNWIRDYIYVPLGGNRKGVLRTYINLFITFSLAGLWHGANWTFLCWGIYHAFFLTLERIKGGILINWMPTVVRHLYTLFILLISWVIFRSTDLPQAFEFIKLLLGLKPTNEVIYFSTNYYIENDVLMALLVGICFTIPFRKRLINDLRKAALVLPRSLQIPLFIAFHVTSFVIFVSLTILSLIYVTGPTFQSFIYFRF